MAQSREAKNESVRSRRRYEGFKGTAEGEYYTKSPLEGQDVRQVYRDNQWHGQSGTVRPATHLHVDEGGALHREEQQQLPGFENPHAVPVTRWEDISEKRQATIQSDVRRKHGVTLDDMVTHIGATLDRAHLRAGAGKAPTGHDFYDEGEPAKVLQRDADEHGVPFGVMAALNAATSPAMKFQHVRKTGEVSYPNQEAAVGALHLARQGVKPEDATADAAGLTGLARTVRPKNFTKAVGYAHQALAGKPISEWRGLPSASEPEGPRAFSGSSPKTAAYHNAWQHDVPGTWVADVHSGAGTIFPHLNPMKGSAGEQKSEQEAALNGSSGLHAMVHHAAEIAMAQRGLTSVTEAQASQWNEVRRHKVETGRIRNAHPEFRPQNTTTHLDEHPNLF